MHEDNDAARLLRWLQENVTEQRQVGLQPIAIIVLSAALMLAGAWIWHTWSRT